MLDRILEAVITARGEFEAERTVSNGMTWAYNVGRLNTVYRPGDRTLVDVELRESIEAELHAYINCGA